MNKDFARLARSRGLLTAEEIEECLHIQRKMEEMGIEKKLWEVIVDKEYLSEEKCREILSSLKNEMTTAAGGLTKGEKKSPRKASPPPLPGMEIMELIGQGSMGEVYKAQIKETGEVVALKILPADYGQNRKLIGRLQREARALSRLDHPHIVTAKKFGRHQDIHYLIMEYIEGKTCQALLDEGKVFGEEETVKIGLAITNALARAHELGIIHRDIKPDNILLDHRGVAKLCDLGLARSEEDSSLTTTGSILGTPLFIPPEIFLGEEDLDSRSDIYSLGVTLYHMITGHSPFGTTDAGQLFQNIIEGKVIPPQNFQPQISTTFSSILLKMMARDREERFSTPRKLLQVLEAYYRSL